MNILMKNQFGKVKEAKTGYSWTTLLFGCFPAAFRGDWKWFFVSAVLGIFISMLTYGIGVYFFWAIWAGFYNKMYTQDLVNDGYYPIGDVDTAKDYLTSKGIRFA